MGILREICLIMGNTGMFGREVCSACRFIFCLTKADRKFKFKFRFHIRIFVRRALGTSLTQSMRRPSAGIMERQSVKRYVRLYVHHLGWQQFRGMAQAMPRLSVYEPPLILYGFF